VLVAATAATGATAHQASASYGVSTALRPSADISASQALGSAGRNAVVTVVLVVKYAAIVLDSCMFCMSLAALFFSHAMTAPCLMWYSSYSTDWPMPPSPSTSLLGCSVIFHGSMESPKTG